MKFFLILSLLFFGVQLYGQTHKATIPVVNLILDTDIGPDYDDVGAMAVMHALADSGEVNILATMASNKSKYIAPVLSVLNTWFGRPGIPIGVVRSNAVDLHAWQKWDSLIVTDYPHLIQSNDQAEDALGLYRKILAAQPDHSVTVCTIGFFTNLSDLLHSGPDQWSSLNGVELVAKKVKQLVSMAGKFPEGKEFNVLMDAASSTYVSEHWPTPIIFSGFEVGEKIHTGLPISRDSSFIKSPVKDVFARCLPMAKEDIAGRMSWDETAVLVAIRGYAGFYDIMEGWFNCDPKGYNSWDENGEGHFYIVQKSSVREMEQLINALIGHRPTARQ